MSELDPKNDLNTWLAWLETLHPKAIDLGLDRIKQVAINLELFQSSQSTTIITVAGTNGKGTCVAALQALLISAGKTVGAYTSPHLLFYNERIAINGCFVDDQSIVDAFHQINLARGDISLSYFEFGTLAACLLFAKTGVDYWLLEVGLGGRLDAVNIFDADIAIVTSIDLDHQDWLGDDREKIGFEKAGVFRAGKIALCVDPSPPHSLLQHANTIGAKLVTLDHIAWKQEKTHWTWQGLDANFKAIAHRQLPNSHLPIASLAAALGAVSLLGLELSGQVIAQTIQQLQLQGRAQSFHYEDRHFVFDVAHNPAAAKHLAEKLSFIQSEATVAAQTIAVFAVMADKDIDGIFQALANLVDVWYLANLDQMPRSAKAAQLAEIAQAYSPEVTESRSVVDAIEKALVRSKVGDTILVFGSFYTVAEALQWRNTI